MAVSLVKGQKISLEKEAGGSLSKVMVGLGWDPVKPKSKGFFESLFSDSSNEKNIDLDASCMMFDEGKKLVDCVFFGHLTSNDGSIIHQGDNLTGEGEGDDEVIYIDLNRISSNIQTILITITSYQEQTFDQIDNAFCRLVDRSNGRELARYTLSGSGNYTAQIMAKIYRHNNEWKMQAIGEPGYGKTIADERFLPTIINFV